MCYYIYCSDEDMTHWEMKDTKETEALKGEEWEKVYYIWQINILICLLIWRNKKITRSEESLWWLVSTNLIECKMILLTQIIYFTLHDENSQIFGQKPPPATNDIQQN